MNENVNTFLMKNINKFLRFLKEKGCYRSFIKNYSNKSIGVGYRKYLYLNFYIYNDYSEYNLNDYLKVMFLNGNEIYLIDVAFDSQYTKEKYKYWNDLSYEWRCIKISSIEI